METKLVKPGIWRAIESPKPEAKPENKPEKVDAGILSWLKKS